MTTQNNIEHLYFRNESEEDSSFYSNSAASTPSTPTPKLSSSFSASIMNLRDSFRRSDSLSSSHSGHMGHIQTSSKGKGNFYKIYYFFSI